MDSKLAELIIKSSIEVKDVINSFDSIMEWIDKTNKKTIVNIDKRKLSDSNFWYYDDQKGIITNKNNSFFYITGIERVKDGERIEQPIIIQEEIGYLGIICKEIKGQLYFLMQAKIEPGNINQVQISPTIQATKSNFTTKHGGNKPNYLEYFLNAKEHQIIFDQIQSEQSSRFFKKRNRNIIILVNEEVEVLENYKWMTLGQIKQLMRYDNIVNMDTRTVLSGIPYAWAKEGLEKYKDVIDSGIYHSLQSSNQREDVVKVYNYINNFKMFDDSNYHFKRLDELEEWHFTDQAIYSEKESNFSVIFCDIEVEGREVRKWSQPLFKAEGIAVFGLIMCNINGVRKFLIKATSEIGCFDHIELGPSVQKESLEVKEMNSVDQLFWSKLNNKEGIVFDTLLSEEGGRFYHEQNRNVIIKINEADIPQLSSEYFWLDLYTLNYLLQVNNILNIQLRNLLSVIEVV